MKNKQGFIVALPDKDVNHGSPDDYALHTDFTTLNMKVDDVDPNQGVINITFKTAGTTPGTKALLFRKVLDPNYLQTFYFGFNQTKSANPTSSQYGYIFGLDIFNDRAFQVIKTGNVVEFYYIVSPFYSFTAGDELTGFFYQFQFAFYLNEGVQA